MADPFFVHYDFCTYADMFCIIFGGSAMEDDYNKIDFNTMQFRLHQPFFKARLIGYTEEQAQDANILLSYEFQTPSIEDMPQGIAYIPTGCVELFFIDSPDRCVLGVVGTTTKLKNLAFIPNAHYFGVRLKPGVCIDYDDLSLKMLIDQEIFIDMKDDAVLPIFFRQLKKAASLSEKSRLFQYYYEENIGAYPVSELTRYTVGAINNSNGSLRIHELADHLHYSERHLSRVFLEHMGISPKNFARIVRFQGVLNAIMDSPDVSLCRCLLEFGYSDQAHFQREFKQYTGITPKHFAMYAQDIAL